jgi:hypothetical protein
MAREASFRLVSGSAASHSAACLGRVSTVKFCSGAGTESLMDMATYFPCLVVLCIFNIDSRNKFPVCKTFKLRKMAGVTQFSGIAHV